MNKIELSRITPLFFILLIIFIIGCDGSSIDQTTDFDPYYGTGSLDMQFMRNMPPYKVYENEDLQLGIKLKNTGANDIESGIVSMVAESDFLAVDEYDLVQPFTLHGRSLAFPNGEEETLFFRAATSSLKDYSEINTKLIALACFDYHTHFTHEICIDPRYYEVDEEKPCTVETITGSGSGGPVVISQVEPRMNIETNNNGVEVVVPQYIIKLSHAGTGDIIEQSRINAICGSGSIDYDDYGLLTVTAMIGNQPMICNPVRPRLRKENSVYYDTFVTCKYANLDLDTEMLAHTSVITVDVYYGYMTRTSTDLTIENMLMG